MILRAYLLTSHVTSGRDFLGLQMLVFPFLLVNKRFILLFLVLGCSQLFEVSISVSSLLVLNIRNLHRSHHFLSYFLRIEIHDLPNNWQKLSAKEIERY